MDLAFQRFGKLAFMVCLDHVGVTFWGLQSHVSSCSPASIDWTCKTLYEQPGSLGDLICDDSNYAGFLADLSLADLAHFFA